MRYRDTREGFVGIALLSSEELFFFVVKGLADHPCDRIDDLDSLARQFVTRIIGGLPVFWPWPFRGDRSGCSQPGLGDSPSV